MEFSLERCYTRVARHGKEVEEDLPAMCDNGGFRNNHLQRLRSASSPQRTINSEKRDTTHSQSTHASGRRRRKTSVPSLSWPTFMAVVPIVLPSASGSPTRGAVAVRIGYVNGQNPNDRETAESVPFTYIPHCAISVTTFD